MEDTAKKPFFVIMWQEEIEATKTQTQLAVYQAVKSFTENGGYPCEQSYLSISKRSKTTDKTTKTAIESLILQGILIRNGEGTKRGGSFPILSILPKFVKRDIRSSESLRSNTESSEPLRTKSLESSELTPESSESSRLNYKQSNKVNNTSTVNEIWDYYITLSNSKEKLLPGRATKITTRLKSYTLEEIKQALKNWAADGWFSVHVSADYIFRSDENIDKLLNLKPDNTLTVPKATSYPQYRKENDPYAQH